MASGRSKNRDKKRKAFFTKQFYLWHWVSSAVCLAAMLFFAVTGITLNRADLIGATPRVKEMELQVPENLLTLLTVSDGQQGDHRAELPKELRRWLERETGTNLSGKTGEWSDSEIYLSLPRPGGDAWMTLDRETGAVVYEKTTRGAISYLNDLHKARHTGVVWKAFLDVFSVACVIFSLTGLGLLYVHAKRRPMSWPLVIAGILLPVLIVVFFVH